MIRKKFEISWLERNSNHSMNLELSFGKTVADSSYANEFNRMNRMRMLEGKAPYTPGSEQYGAHKVYVLHHKQPIHQGGDVYNLDNLIIVSPKTHQTTLDPAYHFGKKGL